MLVPPIHTWIYNFRYFPNFCKTNEIFLAKSYVGAKIKAYMWGDSVSIFWSTPIHKALVLPFPDSAYIIESFFLIRGIIPFYWINDVFKKPYSENKYLSFLPKTALYKSGFKLRSSNL